MNAAVGKPSPRGPTGLAPAKGRRLAFHFVKDLPVAEQKQYCSQVRQIEDIHRGNQESVAASVHNQRPRRKRQVRGQVRSASLRVLNDSDEAGFDVKLRTNH